MNKPGIVSNHILDTIRLICYSQDIVIKWLRREETVIAAAEVELTRRS